MSSREHETDGAIGEKIRPRTRVSNSLAFNDEEAGNGTPRRRQFPGHAVAHQPHDVRKNFFEKKKKKKKMENEETRRG